MRGVPVPVPVPDDVPDAASQHLVRLAHEHEPLVGAALFVGMRREGRAMKRRAHLLRARHALDAEHAPRGGGVQRGGAARAPDGGRAGGEARQREENHRAAHPSEGGGGNGRTELTTESMLLAAGPSYVDQIDAALSHQIVVRRIVSASSA